jgi:hypothetical protein
MVHHHSESERSFSELYPTGKFVVWLLADSRERLRKMVMERTSMGRLLAAAQLQAVAGFVLCMPALWFVGAALV